MPVRSRPSTPAKVSAKDWRPQEPASAANLTRERSRPGIGIIPIDQRDCGCYAARGVGSLLWPLLKAHVVFSIIAGPIVLFGKFKSARLDYITVVAVVAMLVGILVIGGIAYTYKNRPELVEAAQQVLNLRQIFQRTFR